ncbi:hypothetical protein ACFL2H_12780 [Planctomycetota bacterium]
MNNKIAVWCFVVLMGPELSAATISLPIASLTGTYELGGRLRMVDFDLGYQFESIENVTLEFEMQQFSSPACAGFNCYDGTSFDMKLLETGEQLNVVDFDWYHRVNVNHAHVDAPARQLFADTADDILFFSPSDWKPTSLSPTPLDVLSDGKGQIAVRLASGLLPASIGSFKINVTGTLVPEPCHLAPYIVAILAVAFRASLFRDGRTANST